MLYCSHNGCSETSICPNVSGMERLEAKRIKGHTYYYYSKWARVEGRCRRVWQKYLGKLEDIAAAVSSSPNVPAYAEIFEWGLSTALWKECVQAEVVECVDSVAPKRVQGLSTGTYISIAAINRAIDPKSKRSMWQWFSGTTLLRVFTKASKAALSSQRFWDHMDRIGQKAIQVIWRKILGGVIQRENVDLSQISYDGTNYYTFIDTFNMRCKLARRGKNKQGRTNLRQVSYALFCCNEGELPLFFDVYEGNRHDAKQFPPMLKKFHAFLKEISQNDSHPAPDVTMIFDKGNNSQDNFALIDRLKIHYVGSVKLDEHKDLALVSNNDGRFRSCDDPRLKGTKAFEVKQKVYGKERTLVVTYNQKLFKAQSLTVKNDIQYVLHHFRALSQKLTNRASGVVTGGKTPTLASIEKQCNDILSRQHMKSLFVFTVTVGKNNVPHIAYHLDETAREKLFDTYLGKNILITDRESWTNAAIIIAYRSQFMIENIFRETKDKTIGTWWPMHHWTDSKIRVHALYCSVALLLRGLLRRRLAKAGVSLSMKKTISELAHIREVVNFYLDKRKNQVPSVATFTKTSSLQNRILNALNIHPSAGAAPSS